MTRYSGPCMCGAEGHPAVLAVVQKGIRRFIEAKRTVNAAGCWIVRHGVDTNGYPQMRVTGTLVRLSRLSYEAYKGAIGAGLFVCHQCDTRLCVNPDHLWLGTVQDNTADMDSKGRRRSGDFKGARNSNARFTEDDILAIRASELNASTVAKQYSTSAKNIRRIRSGARWSHLPFDAEYVARLDK